MNSHDDQGKQRRGSSPALGETQEAVGDWVRGLRSVQQTLYGGSSLNAREIQHRLDDWANGLRSIKHPLRNSHGMVVQKTSPQESEGRQPGQKTDDEIELRHTAEGEDRWRDDGGEGG